MAEGNKASEGNGSADRVLPIGSVVITKQGNIPLMIVSRGAMFEQDGVTGYFDYACVPYPGGITDGEEFAFFNREDVESVVFFGYVNSDEQAFAQSYDDIVAQSGYPRLSLGDGGAES